MAADTLFVFVLIAVAAALMASNKLRFDIIALLVVIALMLSGVLTVSEALAGFGSSVVMLVAGLLVVGEMLDRTGVAVAIGNWILKKGGSSETRLMAVIMAAAGALGAVMSSTAIVAIFIPIVLRISRETRINASRLLMPMSYAALISGMLTLIATTPNLVVSEQLKEEGFTELGFFSFTPVGLAVLAVAIVYMLLVGRKLLPAVPEDAKVEKQGRSLFDLWEDFRVDRNYQALQLTQDSPLAGTTIGESGIIQGYKVHVVGIVRRTPAGEEKIVTPSLDIGIHPEDTLLVIGKPSALETLATEQNLHAISPSATNQQRWLWELGGASVLVHPESRLIGKSLRELMFRDRYHLQVIGLRRNREAVAQYKDLKLASADNLLVLGPWSEIQQLQARHHDFVVLETPSEQEEVVPAYRRMPVALAILATMVLLSIFNVVPLVAAVLMAVLAGVFSHCLTMEDSYRAIHWSSLVLVAGMLPLADALEKTGGTDIIVNALMTGVGDAGPYFMMSVIFFLTAAMSLFLSNTAAAVLVAPIAIVAAEALGVSPYPFAIAVLIAASAAFVTPVSTPVVALVVEPGRYAFTDFVKVGVPLLLLTWATTLLVAPIFFPFYP
jgi:di/tricarboxylate transporter